MVTESAGQRSAEVKVKGYGGSERIYMGAGSTDEQHEWKRVTMTENVPTERDMLAARNAHLAEKVFGKEGTPKTSTPLGEQPPIMDEDTFMDSFKPRDSNDGSLMWEHEQVMVLVESGEIGDRHVWTAVDTDDGIAYVAGWHMANRFAYLVTQVPWKDGRETCEIPDEDEQDEQQEDN